MKPKLLFLFLDGVGLGMPEAGRNPLAGVPMPHLENLLGGHKMVAESAPYHGAQASLFALDACLGVAGLPQSATGQAVLLTGQNVPALLGYHYGPKPNPAIADLLKNGNLFRELRSRGNTVSFLNAYPPGYFAAIASGRRIYSAIPLAYRSAGEQLMDIDDLRSGKAMAADFTAEGWRTHLQLEGVPTLSARQAGRRMAELSAEVDFALFEYWLSDYAGHRQDREQAEQVLVSLDEVLAGLLENWDLQRDLILVTSDHGNLEDLSTRRHTENPVPALLIGSTELRLRLAQDLHSLVDIAPAITRLLTDSL